ncbi:MAG TPA: FliG C-terminal domain-containing protein [Planctomycetota bacterium]|nr:FliG C-terminal domain-containing protein [Planctomycetota bacterium]
MLNDAHKIAALLLAIDQDLAAEVLRHMGEDQLDMVTRAMKELEEIAVDESDLHSIFTEARGRLRSAGLALGDVGSVISSVLRKAFGKERGTEMLREVEKHTLALRPFSVFEQIPSEDLAVLLQDEHPQIISVFLANLATEKSGEVVAALDESMRADIVHRIATLGRSSPEVVQKVVDVLRSKVRGLGLSSSRSEPKAWIKKAAGILIQTGGEKDMLASISERDEAVAGQIRDEMFTFDDIGKLDKKSMQKILGSIDTGVLAISLKACSTETESNIFENLSKRAREMVVDERDALGPTALSDVLAAQKTILAQVRDLIESGEVRAVGGAAEELV